MKRPSMRQISEEVGCHIDTLFRIKAGRNSPSARMAKRLEEVLGIDRRRFMWPDEFGDPWKILYEKYKK